MQCAGSAATLWVGVCTRCCGSLERQSPGAKRGSCGALSPRGEVVLMTRRLHLLAGILAVFGLVLVAGLGGSASASRAVAAAGPSLLTFTDPAGDASSGAPDITKVTISGDESTGMITFSVTATGLRPVAGDGMWRFVDVWLDTDRNSSTGDPRDGTEYDLYAYTDPTDPTLLWSIDRWNGSGWEQAPYAPATMSLTTSGDTLTWTVNRTDLGGAASFTLRVASVVIDASNSVVGRDRAPDTFTWIYDIAGPPTSMTVFLMPVIGKPTIAPTRMVAGKRVTLTFPVTRTDEEQPKPLASGTMVCNPSVGGKVLPHTESFKNGVARLSFVIPKTAKGKTLKVKVTIKAPSYRGEDGVSISVSTGQMGLVAKLYDGKSSTRITSFRIN